MKKTLAIILALVMIFAFSACSKKQAGIDVYVTISVKGELKLSAEKIRVTDLNNDGLYSIDEALKAAHKKAPNKEASYATEEGAYGLAITKLWDDENGLSGYGYMLNNGMVTALTESIKEGDYICAYSYKDLTYWSDSYAFFDKTTFELDGNEVTVHLNKMYYDEAFNLISSSCAGADIYLNGTLLGQTDEFGNYTLGLNGKGTMKITATAPTQNIVPAVCLAIGK